MPRPFHVMAKPVGAACNLACRYCFYLSKAGLAGHRAGGRMGDDVLAAFTRQYIASQDAPEVNFAWQGGEPTLAGLDFFRRAVSLQRDHAGGKRITNSIQTNGTLLDEEWCGFLAEHDFLVGLSIDGPADLHDAHRVDRGARPTHAAVARAAGMLAAHGVRFNALCAVTRASCERPLDVYRSLVELGVEFLQLIPVVERTPDRTARELGLDLALPPGDSAQPGAGLTPWSVRPEGYGGFLIEIFEEWVGRDVGRVFVQLFDVALGAWTGTGSPVCVHAAECGDALVIETDGSVYACDHYVYPAWHLGNIGAASLDELARSDRQLAFGRAKAEALTRKCRDCRFLLACGGDCPKHRFATSSDGEPGLSFLCPAYLRFFDHVEPYLATMARLLAAGRPAGDIMMMLAEHDRRQAMATAGRNDPCPCGSGRKFKRCCGSIRTA